MSTEELHLHNTLISWPGQWSRLKWVQCLHDLLQTHQHSLHGDCPARRGWIVIYIILILILTQAFSPDHGFARLIPVCTLAPQSGQKILIFGPGLIFFRFLAENFVKTGSKIQILGGGRRYMLMHNSWRRSDKWWFTVKLCSFTMIVLLYHYFTT